MRTKPHHHPCGRCGVRTECCGTIEQNYDGWPEWICVEYHGVTSHDFLCEDCEALPECESFRGGDDCDGGKATEARNDSGGYMPVQHFCKGCAAAYDAWIDNYDPPDADGEAFRGGETAACERESMIAAQRLK